MIQISYRKRTEEQTLSDLAWTLLEEECLSRGIRDVRSRIVYGSHHKPFLKGNEIYFNLSHSGEYALCVVSDRPVGCDIQKIREPRQAVLAKSLSKDERDYILAAGDHEKAVRFTRIWTLREAFVKYTGEGLSRDFKSFHIRFCDNQPVLYTENPEEYEQLTFKEFMIEDYCCACCF